MKFCITMKDPDGFSESVREAVDESLAALDLDETELDVIVEARRERVGAELRRWFEYSEYVTIEVDLKAGTATVKEVT